MPRKMPMEYMEVDAPRLQMAGVGAPRSTVFGVIGRTRLYEPVSRSLGGLVHNTCECPVQPGTVMKASTVPKNTDRSILGPSSKTPMPGAHYGQVPYPGHYASALGAPVS
jgi:hypothetical protein